MQPGLPQPSGMDSQGEALDPALAMGSPAIPARILFLLMAPLAED